MYGLLRHIIKMDKNRLMDLIKNGESESIEFKENFDKETIETTVAFANAHSGIILIGVTDRGKIKGITIRKETMKNWINDIFQATEPTIIPEIENYEIQNKTVVAITIMESPLKPVSYKGTCYFRVKNSNRKLTPKEISEIYLRTIGSSWDSYPARDAGKEAIDIEKIKDYIKTANGTGRRNIKEQPIEVLKKLGLIREDRPTWAAVLLFGKNPQKYALQAKVHCGKFKLSKVEILDDKMVGCDL